MILPPDVATQVRERFAQALTGPVELTLYLRPGSGRLILPEGLGCPTCEDARRLAEELVELAPDKLRLATVDVTQQEVGEDVIDVPLLALGPSAGGAARVRFLGVPGGFEFATLVDAVERISSGDAGLAPESAAALTQLTEPVEVLVFTTPTCRYCPAAVSLANRLAIASQHVTAVTVAADDFPRLSGAFGVQGVPRTVVNRQGAFVGALPEPTFVGAVLQLAGVERADEADPAAEAQGPSSDL